MVAYSTAAFSVTFVAGCSTWNSHSVGLDWLEQAGGSKQQGSAAARVRGFHVKLSPSCLRAAYIAPPRRFGSGILASRASRHTPPRVARIIAIANQKGGVGKTTTAVNLSACLAAAGQRTLLVDADPQGNATSGIGVEPDSIGLTTYDVLLELCRPGEAIHHDVQFKGLDVMPATPDLAGAEVELVDVERREHRMRVAVEPLVPEYDFILIDCPPSLGLITLNMLAAAHAVLIPLQCEYFALEGISHLMKTIELVQQGMNPSLVIEGVALTMYDARLNLSRQVASDTRAFFGDRVFNAVIPRNVRLAEAPSFGKPIITYDISSVGSVAYLNLAKEVIARQEAHVSTGAVLATAPDSDS